MSRLLARPALGDARALTAPEPALDPVVRRLVEDAAAEGYRRGVEDGHAQATAAAERAVTAVRGEVDRVRAELAEVEARETDQLVELACAVAEAVIGREPHDGGGALLERVREVLADLDDTPLQLECHPDDAAVIEEGLRSVPGLTVRGDASLGLGEARITGPWSRATLTRAAAWESLREVLA